METIVVIDEFEKEQLFELIKKNSQVRYFDPISFSQKSSEERSFEFFSILLDSITEHMSEYYVEQWKKGNYEYSIPVYKVSRTLTNKLLNTNIVFSDEEKALLPPEAFETIELYLKTMIIDLKRVEELFEINSTGLTASFSTNEETEAYDTFLSAGISLKDVEFELQIKYNSKVNSLNQEVIEDCESLGITLNTKTGMYVTLDTTDYPEELKELILYHNNTNNVDLTNYEVLGTPIEFLEEEDLKVKQENAKETAELSLNKLYK